MISKEEITQQFRALQHSICISLEKEDGKSKFNTDNWDRPEGGGGISKIIENGDLIEKGGVNFSSVYGKTPENIKKIFAYTGSDFYATGVSIVLHPKNPFVPIIHMNIRYFDMGTHWWFGGGIDLTPHYIDKKDAIYFHKSLKKVCDKHHDSFYGKFKKWADDYFFIKHRNEMRGIGGIFFDRLNDPDLGDKDALFDFSMDVGKSFVPIYSEISQRSKNRNFTERERDWQMVRRGRYVEFNLVLDRGTKFGLETNGRIESILMSLPPLAAWKYNYSAEPGTPEDATQQLLVKNIDWIKK